MNYMNQVTIQTPVGDKHISIYNCNFLDLKETVDVLTVSAFYRNYSPTNRTLVSALAEKKISVEKLAQNPEIDLRHRCNIWLSDEIYDAELPVRRIGCIEMSPYQSDRELWKGKKTDIVSSIQAYFRMLDIASISGIKIDNVAFPIIGSGNQKIDMEFIAIPLLSECVAFLKQNSQVKEIKIIERNPEKAFHFAKILDSSYALHREAVRNTRRSAATQDCLAFISYSSADKNIADNLCSKLENAGIKVWYAPRDIQQGIFSDYASAIVNAVSHCTHFVVILSKNSFRSNHVLNEINLAFQEMTERDVRFCLLKIDEEKMGPAFRYYLSRQHWMDARVPPIEKRLDEFVESIFGSGKTE